MYRSDLLLFFEVTVRETLDMEEQDGIRPMIEEQWERDARGKAAVEGLDADEVRFLQKLGELEDHTDLYPLKRQQSREVLL